MQKINMIVQSREKIVFAEEMNEVLANALRRSASEIFILAVDEVEFYKNDSVLNDQMLAHRIGLIPFKNEKLHLRHDCSCNGEGCAKCTIQLKASLQGPKTVYAKDLKGKAELVFKEMPIVILNENQELEFVAHAKLGRGIEHAKFSPGLVYYRHAYQISLENKNTKSILEKYKSQIAILEKSENHIIADLSEACVHELENNGIQVEITHTLIYIIESFGQLDAKEIFLESIEVLRKNLKILENIS